MFGITSNINEVFGDLKTRLESLGNPDRMLRTVATSMQAVVRDRIHVEGKAADGSQIGTYSKGYMSVRTGKFKNSEKFSRGKNKGKIKNAGTFTRGNNVMAIDDNDGSINRVGLPRPKYNRTDDTKVILSLTRQMESDFSVIATDNGYGLGYNNQENLKKSQYSEATYKKKIFSMTDQEKEQAIEVANDFINNELNGKA